MTETLVIIYWIWQPDLSAPLKLVIAVASTFHQHLIITSPVFTQDPILKITY